MGWKKIPVARGHLMEPAISIQTTGRITWTRPIDEAMGSPTHIDILYDAPKERLGIRAARDGDGLKAQKDGQKYGCRVSAFRTLRQAGLLEKLELPIHRRPARLAEEGVWAISIAPELPIKGRRRHDAYLDEAEEEESA